ncbi:hypothetical protein CR205_04320 [Alteribacter lacisalsi]|uniref:Cell-wall binding lipoprotein n=1 Tax=Alteribacter lacisalsi TaxID=2045244 RepID=A0A2W0HAJ6_9BACI|nr:YkyA family protein [Alteribacter lacisalsi]PYZ97826.1 hypothetical protein CR205_04320 [Alteribacter lacisalsi]
MKKGLMTLGSIGLAALLTGCFGSNAAMDMHEHLENAVEKEQVFQEQQSPLTEAETREHELYSEMLEMTEVEDIEPLSEEAVESAEERRSIIEIEKESIDDAYNEFQEVTGYLDDLEEEARPAAEDMIAAMDARYEAYQDLYDEYMETIDLDIELYNMITQEELTREELQDQHDLVNDAYSRVNSLNSEFNKRTQEYNEAKRTFYQEADLNVEEPA